MGSKLVKRSFGPTLCSILALTLCWLGCGTHNQSDDTRDGTATGKVHSKDLVKLTGETMGTTYAVSYLQSGKTSSVQIQEDIDSILTDFDNCLSTYNPASVISAFNSSDQLEIDAQPCADWFNAVLEKSRQVHLASDGLFDPTIMPLLRYWGFFKEDPFYTGDAPDADALDSLLQFIGMEKQISWVQKGKVSDGERNAATSTSIEAEVEGIIILKKDPRVELDFNAIAKGQGVDALALHLEQSGIENYLIEIGGEVTTSGKNNKGTGWGVAIEKPVEGRREFMSLVRLSGESMASSGNYRRFWERDGKRYVHSLNPLTGKPEMSNLLAVSVVAQESCMMADAWATALMVMGLDKGLPVIEAQTGLEAFFVYLDKEGEITTVSTSGFTKYEVAVAD